MAAAFKTDFSGLVWSTLPSIMTACRELAKCSCSGCHVHVRSCYYQLRRLIRRSSTNVFSIIVHGFVCSRIDYCNPLLLGLPKGSAFPCAVCLKCCSQDDCRLPPYSYISNHSSLLSGSLALEALLIGVHCNKRYIDVYIQYNT